MQIIVCKLVHLLPVNGNKATKPRQCFNAKVGTTKMLQQAGRIMKLTAVIILAACLQVTAAGYGQKISLKEKDSPIEKVLKKIQQQTSYRFLYTSQLLEGTPNVSIAVKDASIEEVLDLCFKGQRLDYEINETTIIIRPRREVVLTENKPFVKDPIEVRGVITDENGAPAQGVNITVKGTNRGTTTNLRGEFVLNGVDENAVLLISSVGYDRQEVAVKGKSLITMQLRVAVGNLDEMQVIAYGKTSKRFNTGNVTTVKAADIENQPVNNPLLALEGRVPGLFVTQGSGLPGSSVSVIIRGTNSIANGTNPFYIIDGVPYVSEVLPGTINSGLLGSGAGADGSGLSNVNGNPLSYINPSDIENIEVLKDADATAIYGSRAANGAILITTKKGKAGKMKVDVNFQQGWGKVTRKMDLLNTQQFLEMRNEAKRNDGLPVRPTDYDINGTWDTTRYTNWQKTLIGGTARYTNLYTSVSGGNTTLQYLVGGTFQRSTTVFPGDFSDQKRSVHFSVNGASPDQRFRVQLTGSYLVDDNRLPGSDLTRAAVTLAPDAPPLYNQDGSLNWALRSNGFSTWSNPLASLNWKYNNLTNNLVSSAIVSYKIFTGLEIKNSFGYTNMQTDESNLQPATSVQPILLSLEGGNIRTAMYAHNNIRSWIAEPQITYNIETSIGKLSALLGSTFQKNTSNGLVLGASGFNSDLVMNDILSAAVENVTSTVNSVFKYNALFGRLSYNWNDKYLINLNGRRDGSSRFGSANQFHYFGSVGIGWIFSKEAFVRNHLAFLSFGKIRGSYGTTGSDQIGDYKFLDLYNSTNATTPYQGTAGLQVNSLYNLNLAWELTKKLEASLDVGFLEDRILVGASYFLNRSSNQLISETLPSLAGFLSIQSNLPGLVQNKGLEIVLNTININGNKVKWSSSFNISVVRNKLLSVSKKSFYTSLIGRSLGATPLYHFLGVNDTSGLYQFSDINGNATYSPASTDQIVFKDLYPRFYGGFSNSFTYGQFQLDILFQFIKQTKANYLFGNNPGRFGNNQPDWILNRWRKPGDIAAIQRFNSNGSIFSQIGYATNSDACYADASFIRLRNISISWQMPSKWKTKPHVQNFRIYAQADNLLTFTSFKGMDPENGGVLSLPPLRMITTGIQITL